MATNGFFNGLGESIGEAIRFIVDVLAGFFAGIGIALYDFIEGLTSSLGMDASVLGMVALVIGLLLLYKGVRAFLRGAVIAGLCWTFIGLLVLSWLIA